MAREKVRQTRDRLAGEINLCPGSRGRGGLLSVCLVSPSPYRTGMSSLGFQSVYRLLTSTPGISCERAFLPEPAEVQRLRHAGAGLASLESGRPLADFDVVAFSTSFEPDYINIPLILSLGRIPARGADRSERDPLVIAGGAAFFINPEPVAEFIDMIGIGEAEPLLPPVLEALMQPAEEGRQGLLQRLSHLPGIYVPVLRRPVYDGSTLRGFETAPVAAPAITRVCAPLERTEPASSVILTEETEFGDMFLVEVSRGCPRGCRFCTSGFIYGPFRQHGYEALRAVVDRGLEHRSKVGLVGAAVSDHREIGRLCRYIVEKGAKVSVSSLRIDRLDTQMVDALVASGHRTISLAPEGGSQRLRDLIRKNLNEAQILAACRELTARQILNLKLYFIIGLPTETDEDLAELIRLVKRIREEVLEAARANRRMGSVSVSVNPFIPKPFTPFQWCCMEPLPSLERKAKWLEKEFRALPNVELKVESLKGCYLQALLSRGDRRLASLVEALAAGKKLKQAAAQAGIDTDALVARTIPVDEVLPWDIIGSDQKPGLQAEYRKAFPSETV